MNIIPNAYASFELKDAYPFGGITSLGQGLNFLTGPIFMIAGLGVVSYFFFGAFKYLTSGGDKNATSAAQAMITHAIIGFVLLIFIFLFLQFLPDLLGLKGLKIIQ